MEYLAFLRLYVRPLVIFHMIMSVVLYVCGYLLQTLKMDFEGEKSELPSVRFDLLPWDS